MALSRRKNHLIISFETDNRFPRAAHQDNEVDQKGGSDTVTLTTSQMPSHSHTVTDAYNSSLGSKSLNNANNSNSVAAGQSNTTRTTSSKGNSQSHENKPPYVSVFFIIKTYNLS